MASRTAVSGLQLIFPFLAILFIASGRVNAQVTCQTSGASPLAVDANNCVNFLINLGSTECCQNDCSNADACTTMCEDETAASAICGNCGQCVPCQQAGNFLANIIENCESSGQVGVSGLQLIFPFLAILFIASGRVNAEVNAQVTCQTSGASPLAVDANSCVNFLTNLVNTQCCQNDCSSANGCTTMFEAGTAATAICGNCGQCVPCEQAENFLANIIENCDSNSQVGGFILGFTNPTVNVNVFHT